MNKKVLVVAAHSDDEVLGCGGTIAKHAMDGDEVKLVLMADGTKSRPGASREDYRKRIEASHAAAKILGIKDICQLDFPDNAMDSVPILEIVQKFEKTIGGFSPEIVYTHHQGDLNVDHRISSQVVMTAFRPMPLSPVKQILSFEVVSSTDWAGPGFQAFHPNLYVDISDYLEKKMEALASYRMEMADSPHSRSFEHVQALARHRGFSVGKFAAEAFAVLRIVR